MLIYQHESSGADQVIADAIDRQLRSEHPDDEDDEDSSGALVPASSWHVSATDVGGQGGDGLGDGVPDCFGAVTGQGGPSLDPWHFRPAGVGHPAQRAGRTGTGRISGYASVSR